VGCAHTSCCSEKARLAETQTVTKEGDGQAQAALRAGIKSWVVGMDWDRTPTHDHFGLKPIAQVFEEALIPLGGAPCGTLLRQQAVSVRGAGSGVESGLDETQLLHVIHRVETVGTLAATRRHHAVSLLPTTKG